MKSDGYFKPGESHPHYKHGMCGTPTWITWRSMIARCKYPAEPSFKYYGGRGIKICERWNTFENFLSDMGIRPEGTSLDRIDSNGNYEPLNCRWATYKKQANNRRNSRTHEFNGKTLTIKEWAELLNLNVHTLRSRIQAGWPIEKVLKHD